jgi:hypothetical protein
MKILICHGSGMISDPSVADRDPLARAVDHGNGIRG